jgi:predicted transcriptional regulator of viral defense system
MYIRKLLNTKKTVFSTEDLKKLFEIPDPNYLNVVISRLVGKGDLLRLFKGIYCNKKDFNVIELANKLKRPSYVSLETILYKKGIIFQPYERIITSVSDTPDQKEAQEKIFLYRQIKGFLLANPAGIVNDGTKVYATPERATLDLFYLSGGGVHLDNIESLDLKKLSQISAIFPKTVQEEVKKLC